MIIKFKCIDKARKATLYSVDYHNVFPRFNIDSLLKHDKGGNIN